MENISQLSLQAQNAGLSYQNTLLKMQVIEQQKMAEMSKKQLLLSFNKQYPGGKNTNPGDTVFQMQKVAESFHKKPKTSPKNQAKNHQISIVNHNSNHHSAKKTEEKSKSGSGKERNNSADVAATQSFSHSFEVATSKSISSMDVQNSTDSKK